MVSAQKSGQIHDMNTSLYPDHVPRQHFDEREAVEVLVNFEPNQHADFERDIGGRIHIHSSLHIGSIKGMSHPIEPGHRYQLYLAKKISKRLPRPYDSGCRNYELKSRLINSSIIYPSLELSPEV